MLFERFIYLLSGLPNMRQKNFIFGGNNPVPEAKTAKLALLPRNLLSIEREVKGDLSRVEALGRKKHNPRQSDSSEIKGKKRAKMAANTQKSSLHPS